MTDGKLQNNQTVEYIPPNDFVEWQKKCVCDFENNGNTHSLSCLERWYLLVTKRRQGSA